MGSPISFKARQRFRQRLHNIEDADEILDALNQFLDRFTIISGNFSSSAFQTIYELEPNELETTMITYSILGKESSSRQAGFKRTAIFYREAGVVSQINIQQTDFSNQSFEGFNARILAENGLIKLQVKGATNNLTRWKGSIEIEKLGE